MSEEWDYYFCRVDDESASIFLDMGIAQSAPIPGFGKAAYLRLWMKNPRPDGLSSQEEFDTLAAIGDALTDAVGSDGATIYVGRNTSSGRRDFFFYTKSEDDFRASISAAMSKFADYVTEIGLRPDENWIVYFDFLYPSGDHKQVMANRQTIAVLREHGDDCGKPRQVDHLIEVGDLEQGRALAGRVSGLGFNLKPGMPCKSSDAKWRVEFHKIEAPAKIDETPVMLWKLARESGGDYDGWGCEVEA